MRIYQNREYCPGSEFSPGRFANAAMIGDQLLGSGERSMAKRSGTRGEVALLTLANGTESALRLLVPIVLVRAFDQEAFGEYRLFWLVANTLMLFVPLGIGRSLMYFLPRSTPAERGAFVSQSLFYFAVVGLPFAACFGLAPAWMPDKLTTLTEPPAVFGAFVYVWLLSSLINVLPNADRNIRWQAVAIAGCALVRTAIVVSVAWLTKDLQAVFIALLGFSILQCVLLGYYVVTRHGRWLRWPQLKGLKRQFTYSAPFGLSGILARARRQIELWIVVALYTIESLAVFSIAVSFSSVQALMRSSVGNVVLPKMSKEQAAGDVRRALELNNRGNLSICFLIYPFVAFIWVYATPLVSFLYTDAYVNAVPIVRIYALNMLVTSVELATVLLIYEQGRFVMTVSAGVLIGASVLSYVGALTFGLPGVAIGGLVGTLVARSLNFGRAARVLGIRFGELQDWSTLGRMLLAASIAGAVATGATGQLPDAGALTQLAVGGCVLGAVYLLLMRTFGLTWVPLAMLGRGEWPRSLSSLD